MWQYRVTEQVPQTFASKCLWDTSYVNSVVRAAANFSPTVETFFLLQFLVDLNKTKTKEKVKIFFLCICMIGVHGAFLHWEMTDANWGAGAA